MAMAGRPPEERDAHGELKLFVVVAGSWKRLEA